MSNIVFKNINKKYGNKVVLNNIDLNVENEFLFLAGKNGSGKTTFIKCALELLELNDGKVLYDDRTVDKARDDVAVVFDEPKLYMDFSGNKNIKIFTQGFLQDAQSVDEILDSLELSSELLSRKVRTYSLGQRHRLAVAIALIKKPQYIFLDEPTIGLDPISWGLVKGCLLRLHKEKGMTAIITGQDYEEMEQLCETVAILHKGKIVIHSQIKKLIEAYPNKVSFEHTGRINFTENEAQKMGILQVESDGKRMFVQIPRENLDVFIDKIYAMERPINLKVEDYTLKEVFLSVVENNGGNIV